MVEHLQGVANQLLGGHLWLLTGVWLACLQDHAMQRTTQVAGRQHRVCHALRVQTAVGDTIGE